MYVINESGVYCLIFGSKLESAQKFKRRVTSDVLPMNESFTVNGTMGVLINKSGLYSLILSSKMLTARTF